MTDACCSGDASGVVLDALADDPAPAGDDALDVVPAPTMAEVDACRYVRWHAVERLRAHAFRSVVIPLPRDYVEYLLADGLSLAADSEAMPARVAPELDELVDSAFTPEDEADDALAAGDASFEALRARFGRAAAAGDDDDDDAASSSSSEGVGVAPVRDFPDLDAALRAAIDQLGGLVTPKLTWSAPKDATWMATTNTTRCQNPGEIHLLLKASDAIAYDLQDAYAQCVDCPPADHPDAAAAAARLVDDASVVLRKWADLNPSMEFRCFVRGGNLRGICQRDVSNFYPFLPSQVEWLEETLAVFWQERVHGAFPGRDYCFDVYVTSKRNVKLVDFNPWGGATLPLLFEWGELAVGREGAPPETSDGEGGFTDDLEFRVVTSQGHIRPGAQLGVPFDMYDRAPDGALANFVAQQRKRQEAEMAAEKKEEDPGDATGVRV